MTTLKNQVEEYFKLNIRDISTKELIDYVKKIHFSNVENAYKTYQEEIQNISKQVQQDIEELLK